MQFTTSIEAGQIRAIRNAVKLGMRTDLIGALVGVFKLPPPLLVITFN